MLLNTNALLSNPHLKSLIVENKQNIRHSWGKTTTTTNLKLPVEFQAISTVEKQKYFFTNLLFLFKTLEYHSKHKK